MESAQNIVSCRPNSCTGYAPGVKAAFLGSCGPGDFDLPLPDGTFARIVPDVVYLSYRDVPRRSAGRTACHGAPGVV